MRHARKLSSRTASYLRIAGIGFEVTPAPGVHLLDDDRDEYRPFVGDEPRAGDPLIRVSVECEEPVVPAGTRIFQGDRSWSGHALEGGDFLFAFGRPDAPPLITARTDAAVTRVLVSCSPAVLQDGALYNPLRYPLDQLLMIHRLALEGGAVVHCCAVAVERPDAEPRVVLCPGVSGAGKTTLSAQLRGVAGLEVLSDDRAVIRCLGGRYEAWGTPWPGTGRYAVDGGLPLAALAFLDKGPVAAATPLAPREALLRMARVASVPWYDRELGPRVFDALGEICHNVPVYRLAFAPDPSVAAVIASLAG